MPHFDTAGNIASTAALELGLVDAAIADPWASTDQNIIQLRTLLTRVGRTLVRARAWTHLTEEYTFNTAASTESYALPAGFERFKNATAWNRDTQWPLAGPISGPQWQAVKARTSSGMVVRPFRIRENLLFIYPTPSAIEAVYYEYLTRYWVLETGQSAPNTDTVDAYTDVLWFDEPLLVAGLKLAFLRAKQKDTTYAQAEFDEVFNSVASGDGGASAIQITGCAGVPLIGEGNLPDTGWGS